MTAALSKAQQQRQDVDGAGGLRWLLGGGRGRVSLGHTKLLSHCGKHMDTWTIVFEFEMDASQSRESLQ